MTTPRDGLAGGDEAIKALTEKQFDRLSLTRKLVLELLAARHRCGEAVWTLNADRSLRPVLEDLARDGWLTFKSGVVEASWLSSLTDAGKRVLLSGDYEPPIAARVHAEAVAATAGDREALGRIVRAEWVAWASEQADPKPSWLAPWEQLPEADREVDRRIGQRLYSMAVAEHRADLQHRIEVSTRYEDDRRVALAERDEYHLDVAGHVICDSLTQSKPVS